MINYLGTFPSLPFYGGAFPRPPLPIWTLPPWVAGIVVGVIIVAMIALAVLTHDIKEKELRQD